MNELLRRYGLNGFLFDGANDGGSGGGGEGGTGEEGGDKGGGETKPPEGGTGKTISQEEADRIMARTRGEARSATLKKFGFATEAEAEAELKRLRDLETKNLSDLDREKKEAEDSKLAGERATADAQEVALTARVERALERAGVPQETSAEVRSLVRVEHTVADEDLKTAVEDLKKKLPALFEASKVIPTEEDQKPAGGDPGYKPQTPGKVVDRKEAAAKLVAERHPEIARRKAEQQQQQSVTT